MPAGSEAIDSHDLRGAARSTNTRSTNNGEPRADEFSTDWLVVLGVFLVMAAYSWVMRPMPSVNEPHYLCKARHYWQPEWCAGDFFLQSSNPHLVFYQTIGVFTRWMSLTQAAWVGRVVGLSLLAWGWTRMVSRLCSRRWAPLSVLGVFLLFQTWGNFSGEWLVGGIESKVIAYALGFAGLASWLDRRLWAASALLGLAISFHPVVGGWILIATLGGAGRDAFRLRYCREANANLAASINKSDRRMSPRHVMVGGLLLIACALPGVIPALQVLSGVNAEVAATADRIQVGLRLAHHLDPMRFPLESYRYYLLLLVIAGLLRTSLVPHTRRSMFDSVLLTSILIALFGVLVGIGERPLNEMWLWQPRTWLLKFYPFRLADILLPMSVSVGLIEWLSVKHRESPAWRYRIPEIMGVGALITALWLPNADRNSSRMTSPQQEDWIATCDWVREQTPSESLLYASDKDWAVKWFAHRAEYVNYKDCPQDAPGIIEWARRLKRLRTWYRESLADRRISVQELADLRSQTGITHLLVSQWGPIDARPVFANESFRVFHLPESTDSP